MTEILDRIRESVVGLRMPRALEALDHTLRRLERGEVGALDGPLAEEHATSEDSRIAAELKTLGKSWRIISVGFDLTHPKRALHQIAEGARTTSSVAGTGGL